MKSKGKTASLRRLSHSVGGFIRYWGFRRIHGAIWCQLYLSKTPLSCTELAKRIAVSKALVSPALDELIGYKLIVEAPSPNDKTKLYSASENVSEVIQHVLKTRESVILSEITADYSDVEDVFKDNDEMDKVRLQKLGEMIVAANLMLQILLHQKDLLRLPSDFEP